MNNVKIDKKCNINFKADVKSNFLIFNDMEYLEKSGYLKSEEKKLLYQVKIAYENYAFSNLRLSYMRKCIEELKSNVRYEKVVKQLHVAVEKEIKICQKAKDIAIDLADNYDVESRLNYLINVIILFQRDNTLL